MGDGAQVRLTLPTWMEEFLRESRADLPTVDARMQWVVELARRNVDAQLGGPFAAAVFERDSGRRVSAGVNLVVATNCSVLHAEVVAILLAHQALGRYDLSAGGGAFDLVVSAEPCVMCFGAVHWCGVRRLVYGARAEDSESIGFDEGSKRADWADVFRRSGIAVLGDVRRAEAVAVLRRYREKGGVIYGTERPPAPGAEDG